MPTSAHVAFDFPARLPLRSFRFGITTGRGIVVWAGAELKQGRSFALYSLSRVRIQTVADVFRTLCAGGFRVKEPSWVVVGRLAQLVRAPALQAGGRRFESCTAHHLSH